jgi:hypothetical protein
MNTSRIALVTRSCDGHKASIESDGFDFYLCCNEKKLMIADNELYVMITEFMKKHYGDLNDN